MSLSKLSLSPFAQGSSPTLAHINRLLASTSGQDKVFMFYAYSAHIAQYILKHKSITNKKRLDLATRIGKVQAVVSDARVLFRIFGLFPIIQWAQSLNSPATAPKDKRIRWIERAQAWSMMLFYPMEAAYYLAGKGAWDMKPTTVRFVSLWACRFWATYVMLQIAHNHRSRQLLSLAQSQLLLSRSKKLSTNTFITPEEVFEEKTELKKLEAKKSALERDLLVQVGYAPLTLHWSLPNGLLPDNVWVGLFGSLAAGVGLKNVWLSTA